MKTLLIRAALLLSAVLPTLASAQSRSPYQTRLAVDGPVIGALLVTTGVAFNQGRQDEGLTDEEVAALRRDDVNRFDRFAAGNYDPTAKRISDYPFYASFAAPLVLALADGDVRSKAGQVGVLYLETLSVTGALFTVATAAVPRSRPLAYSTNPELTISQRGNNNSTNSFFAGHTAATATNTFFVAKVFHDFHPESAARPYVWAAAAAVPAAVGYLRLKAGKHFLSDNLVGYAVGAASGILVPQLHKKNRNGFSVVPMQGLNANGYSYGGLLLTKRL
ncbi:phosphatase PAP2 family protein [Hymenobacter latericus]|uniref:phosphatase PAP2 family protein n=1 Tax=Hymenobacter sp. YIM 151858-1 TaxID=2987688 RepID=UPI0022274E9E|nr:phosphatase PAP2 family protein [Hymenobacter sp. YIM 151858-1]UYZ58825.1 phosphatase PAP2 family protein [Hymenobacter sp. YIM 151858-1]